MNKKLVIVVCSAMLLALPLVTFALAIPGQPNPNGTINVVGLLTNIFDNIIWPSFIVLAIVYLLIVGLLFLLAQGDPTKVATARMALLWGIIGIVVMALALSLPGIIGRTFGV